MRIEFIKLNKDWNAEPNAPEEKVFVEGADLVLEFTVNPWAYEGFDEGERSRLIFEVCSKYRLGPTNDDGWYRGQCRYGKLAPNWGEFYLVKGSSSSNLQLLRQLIGLSYHKRKVRITTSFIFVIALLSVKLKIINFEESAVNNSLQATRFPRA